LGRVADGVVEDIWLAMGSVAPIPLRLSETERIIRGKRIDPLLAQSARRTAAAEIRPIDDIRSTSRYRAAVAGNLVAEFLEQLSTREMSHKNISDVLARWNALQPEQAAEEIFPCCGSKAWANGMAARRALRDEAALLSACDQVWKNLRESDWLEAFRTHPRIGESQSPAASPARSAAWSGEEQRKVGSADENVMFALAEGNRAYEQRFNRIFIVCATGKSAPEILEILQRRLRNDEKTELHEAAEQQRQIAHLRLKKWLSS
jgi:2-oxo-4-hydroxy-4-carboxy-5-ureidoimidazoline decarboxylase